MSELKEALKASYHLYDRERSSCARRVRIALALKAVPNVILHDVDMTAKEHITDAYRALNPSGAVPTLVVEMQSQSGGTSKFVLTQSTAILEYLDEVFPNLCPLLPPVTEVEQRAKVRELVAIVTQDIFPFVNRRNADRIREIRDSEDDQLAFVTRFLYEGFDAYEKIMENGEACGAKFSVGENVTLADVCLVPQVLQAKMWGVDVCEYGHRWPLINSVIGGLEKIEAFGREMG
ncbi:thioredoxin-like protein [Clathrospora elynae]|uniref:Thioredoxin-like protein n=1 Tax=Clathrospora elynae TaxID=706981 RepID=A0A6A5SWQ6_9PLEO|nr:thioredoxin-like protein [Clathrospora elynae]